MCRSLNPADIEGSLVDLTGMRVGAKAVECLPILKEARAVSFYRDYPQVLIRGNLSHHIQSHLVLCRTCYGTSRTMDGDFCLCLVLDLRVKSLLNTGF